VKNSPLREKHSLLYCQLIKSKVPSTKTAGGVSPQKTTIISPDTLAPHCLVEASVNADIRSSHLLHGELADLLDGAWSPLLETPAKIISNINHFGRYQLILKKVLTLFTASPTSVYEYVPRKSTFQNVPLFFSTIKITRLAFGVQTYFLSISTAEIMLSTRRVKLIITVVVLKLLREEQDTLSLYDNKQM